MNALAGATVALFESRMATELAGLVERHGGRAHQVPAVREVALPAEHSEHVIDGLVRGTFDVAVLLTGAGVRRLFESAEESGRGEAVTEGLRCATIVCRGPKPAAVLRARGITPNVLVPSPHTTDELLAALEQIDVGGKHVLVTHAGEIVAEPAASLAARGAEVTDLQTYQWDLPPADAERLQAFVDQLAAGAIDAVAFTTQVQVRNLFQIAERAGQEDSLREALSARVVVAAVGPTCAEALRSHGVEPDVEPVHPKMGHMVVALARHWEAYGGKAPR
ncbi:MAG: uroporphyrinogen-III synthase [Gemmatimonadaceae bacterium]